MMPDCASCPSAQFCRPIPVPPHTDRTEGDLFIRQMNVPDAGTFLRQHVHAYSHTSKVVAGSCSVARMDRAEPEWVRLDAPAETFIPAGVPHAFLTHEPHTMILCIHRLAELTARGTVEVLDGRAAPEETT